MHRVLAMIVVFASGCMLPSYRPSYVAKDTYLGSYDGASLELYTSHNFGEPIITIRITLPDGVHLRILGSTVKLMLHTGKKMEASIVDPITLYDANSGTVKVREVPLSGVYVGETAMASIQGPFGPRLQEVHDTFYLYAKLSTPPKDDFRLTLPRIEVNERVIDLKDVHVERKVGVLFNGNW